MGTQDTLLSIGNHFNVSRTTVMNIVNRLLYFTLRLKKMYIKFPKTERDFEYVAEGFKKYPGVAGAIDGTHIFVTVKKEQQDSYIDRYRRHSINLMVICDASKMLTYAFVGFPGSAHDSRVFQNSLLYQEIEQHGPNSIFLDDQKYHIIGDSAFPLKTWLMTPYKGNNLTVSQKYHNYCLSAERVVVEHTIGTIKGRWRRLQYINTYHICKSIEIATAACVLHNFCLLNNDIWAEQAVHDRWDVNNGDTEPFAGRIKRDRIKNMLHQQHQQHDMLQY
ncbi:unnamed protein product [Callosobruchus maculatus]|uniref:DDE Tnp4 domain-containing protein n=1 Tax=Callosobruchus maculatus TaxID=64391 RepID=A0A653BWA7_CALMS|nr:unnamed protein product [Callosobruchus maculatus]